MIILIIDVSDIIKDIGAIKEFSGDFLPDDVIFQGESIGFNDPFLVEGSVMSGKDGLLIVQARVKGHTILQCGACLELFSYHVDFAFTAEFKTSGEDPDIYIYDGKSIDLKDAIMDNFFLELPIKRRCREDCKGLCPHCGINLNENQCTCEKEKEQDEDIDSRLAVLKEFFSTRDKEV